MVAQVMHVLAEGFGVYSHVREFTCESNETLLISLAVLWPHLDVIADPSLALPHAPGVQVDWRAEMGHPGHLTATVSCPRRG